MAMIRAVIFDLDGTLVQTEILKAESYGKASVELCPACASEKDVTEAFKDVVGRSREEVSQALMERFQLTDSAREHMDELDVDEPWEAFAETRMQIYEKLLQDPNILRSSRLVHNIHLLREVRRKGYKTALATTSQREPAMHVLDVLGITDQFDFICTADDVELLKPDPQIYILTAAKLDVPANQCLAIEDSPPGVQAALSSGACCIGVTTDFTRDAMHESKLLDEKWIVDDPKELKAVFERMIDERKQEDSYL